MAQNTTNDPNYKVINGVTYFKLQSKYPGDYTKNCGLLGEEIDGNFYFLRGNDIKDITVESGGTLTVTRVDDETFSTNVPFNDYKFKYDKDNGSLIVTHPDGKIDLVEGFLVEQYVSLATNETILGTGAVDKPLALSPLEKTGTYAPVKKLINLASYDYYYKKAVTANSIYDNSKTIGYVYCATTEYDIPEGAFVVELLEKPIMPNIDYTSPFYICVRKKDAVLPSGATNGDRYVTKEVIDNFGLLYDFSGVNAITKALEEKESPWRIPTIDDWNDLLNAAEYCESAMTHNDTDINVWQGKDAGSRAKSRKIWLHSDKTEEGVLVHGEDSLPSGSSKNTFRVLPVGYGEGSRGVIGHDRDFDLEGFRKLACFWSTTPAHGQGTNANILTKTFGYETRKVLLECSKPSSRLSIRLVRDYDQSVKINDVENILGEDFPCTVINGANGYAKAWTCINVGLKDGIYSGLTSSEWAKSTPAERGRNERYYINEWNGESWVKRQMKEGDSVVIIDGGLDESGNTIYNHEWRVYSGVTADKQVLMDVVDAMKGELQEEIDRLDKRIDEEISARTENDAILSGYIEDLRYDTEVSANTLLSAITVLRHDTEVSADTEMHRAMSAETFLSGLIWTEEVRALSAETWLNEKIDDEISGLTIVESFPNATDIRAEYRFLDRDKRQHGDTIKIYKDKAIHKISGDTVSGHTVDDTGEIHRAPITYPIDVLIIVYKDETGTYQLAEFDLDEVFKMNAGLGIEFDGKKINVKISPSADTFLHIDKIDSAVTLSGVQFNFESVTNAVGLSGNTKDGWKYESDKYYVSAATTVKGALDIIAEKLWEVSGLTGGLREDLDELSAATIESADTLDKKINELSAATIESADTLDKKINELSAATIESANTLSGYIKTLRHDTEVSANTEMNRAMSAETFLSGAIEDLRYDTEVSANTLLSAITVLRHDTEVSANTLSGLIWTEEVARESGDTNIANILGISGNTDEGFTVEFTRPEYKETVHSTTHGWAMFSAVPKYTEIVEQGYWDFTQNKAVKNEYIEITGASPVTYYQLFPGTTYIISAKTYMEAIVALDKNLNRVEESASGTSGDVKALSGKVINEIARAEAAEGSLSGSIDTLRHDTNVSAKTLQDNITAEENRATAAEDFISGATSALSATVGTFSAGTVAEIARLDGQDIDGTNIYNLDSQGNVILNRKNGTDTITIHFTGNFGQI